ncbi:layilin [Latimeria chalumnae]|uniref:Layilin n=1 Tax=Latimeria chalumnae TaxID=7897 RepID=H3BHR2_LATCH|nr:PREDICTED: layilin [Latimeria chalumnae]|eukprot:XP_005987324.1 PREDICTED: layilin [Latimeria chalumnae]
MELIRVIATIFAFSVFSCKGSKLRSGQTVCRGGTRRPCYKIVYFSEASSRVNFEEAQQECRSDGGHLVSIESEHEQKLIEKLIQGLSASDGDFWIGLRRRNEEQGSSDDCPNLYEWVDGSKAKFRNWYVDEPSCGSEICVVMYHQPSASSGIGGPYMFQWNDDRCKMKNNFICKYSQERPTASTITGGASHVDAVTVPIRPKYQEVPTEEDTNNDTVTKTRDRSLNIAYIIIPTIPLLLLLIVASGVFCFRLFARRKKERAEPVTKEHNFWMSPLRSNSPNLEIYSVIRKQNDADLAVTRPNIKNTSFRASSGDNTSDNLSGDYDNMAGNASESGFVTLASTESGFVNNEIYEYCSERAGRGKDSGWVENEIYGY